MTRYRRIRDRHPQQPGPHDSGDLGVALFRDLLVKIGFILNPIAGLGGTVGLKGSDGVAAQALALGASPKAPARAQEALRAFGPALREGRWLTGSGPLGASLLGELGASCDVLHEAQEPTTAQDTRILAQRIRDEGADLLLFAGGDGTARDLLDAIGRALPVLGIPAGVKMQSAVFGVSPAAAGALAARFLKDPRRRAELQEVLDLDEEALRAGDVRPRLHGLLSVPTGEGLQGGKVRAIDEAESLAALAREAVSLVEGSGLVLVGPGRTTLALKNLLGGGSLLGIDAYRNGAPILKDATEAQLLEVVGTGPFRLILTCIGGQGHLLGRGNAPLSHRVLAPLELSHLLVLATPRKLATLRGEPFRVDSGDPATDRRLSGWVKVVTGFRERSLYRVVAETLTKLE